MNGNIEKTNATLYRYEMADGENATLQRFVVSGNDVDGCGVHLLGFIWG